MHQPLHAALAAAILTSLPLPAQGTAATAHDFPPRGDWATARPADVGMNADKLAAAVRFARQHDSGADRDLRRYIARTLANEPHGEIVGPTRDRGDSNGVIVRRGRIVAEWGPTRRVDMTFSVTKTYLSTVVGLAFDRGMIRSVDDPAAAYVPTDHFDGEHNAKITWDHLLRQTSDWRGTLWTKPDWADRPPRGVAVEQLPDQPLHEPGSHYRYNDVRVNLLALAALHVWRRPLPEVLRVHVMDPIGASNTWRWHGYATSWIVLDGQHMQSVSGGGHWGGGMHISTRDQARLGYLFLRDGMWDGRRIISEKWIAMARTPGRANPGYGYMNWFLNTPLKLRDGRERRALPSAPATAVTFRGAGSNIVYVDWENDLVIVLRWFDREVDGLVGRVLAAIEA